MQIRSYAPCNKSGFVDTEKDLPCSNEGCGNKATRVLISTERYAFIREDNSEIELKPWFALCPKCIESLLNEMLTLST